MSEVRDWVAGVDGCEDEHGQVSRYRLLEDVIDDVYAHLASRNLVTEPSDCFNGTISGTHVSSVGVIIEGMEQTYLETIAGLRDELKRSEARRRGAEHAQAQTEHQVAELSKALEATRNMAGLMQQSWQSSERTLKAALDMNEMLTRANADLGASCEALNRRVHEIEGELA